MPAPARPVEVVLLLAVLAAPLGAQAAPRRASYAFASWGTAEGLPQANVVGIAEDREGYLWVATTGTLSRFDGRSFREVPLGDAATRGLDPPRTLLTDRAGDVWLLRSGAGVARIATDGRMTRDTAPPPVPAKLLAMGPGDSVWAADSGVVWLRHRGAWQEQRGARYAVARATALLVDGTGAAWVAGTRGLARLGPAGLRTWHGDGAIARATVHALAPAPAGAAWAGSERGLALVAPAGAARPVRIDSGGTGPVHAIAVDRDGRLWLAGDGGVRLVQVDSAPDGSLRGRTLVAHPAALGGARVMVLHLDSAGRLWIGTEGAGLHQLRPLAISRLRRDDGLPARVVHEVLGDGADGLWIAGGCTGLSHWRAGVVTTHRPPAFGLVSECVEGLARDRAGRLWIGERGRFVRMDPSGARVAVELPGPKHPNVVGPFLEDRRGRMWVAAARGLGRVEADGRFVYPLQIDGLDSSRVWSMVEDEAGAVWLGQVGRASRIVDDRVVTHLGAADGVPPGALRALLAEAPDGLWMASYGGGLARYAPTTGVRRLTRADGFFDDALSTLVRDRADRLWLLGDRGLAVAPRADLLEAVTLRRAPRDAVVFGPRDSMPEGNGGFPNAWLDERERLWLATVDGVASVDAGAFPFDRTPVRARVDEVRVDGVPLDMTAGVRVPPGDHALEFAFSAPNLDATDRVRFRYRLAGHDPEWVEAGTARVARYARVRPGSYAFELVGRNVDGIEAREPVVVAVTLAPAWWQRAWVRLLGALLAGWLAWRWHRRRLARMDARTRLLQTEIEERKRAQLEASRAASELAHLSRVAMAGELATSLAHELNQPLSAVTSNALAAQQMHGLGMDDEMAPVLDDIVAQSRRAAGVVRSMRSFVRKQEPAMAPVEPGALVEETLRLLQGELTMRGVVAATEVAGAPARVRGDHVQLQQVLVNLLLNAADAVRDLPAERRGIAVAVQPDGADHVRITVSDRGPGLDAAALARIFDPFYTTKPTGLGIGLALSRTIVEAHAGSLAAASDPGRGTTMHVRLPAWKDA
jgi:signal transduction histidine kinase/ligand-binding sensor domain-containing protein